MLSLEDFYDHNEVVKNNALSLEQELVYLETLLELKESNVSLESAIPILTRTMEMANVGTSGYVSEALIMEHYNLSTESLKDTIASVVSKIGNFVKGTVDNIAYIGTWWRTQHLEIEEMSLLASKIKGSVVVEVPVNTFYKYGNNVPVKTFKEYVTKFKEMTDNMVELNKEIATFTRSDLFSGLTTLVSTDAFINKYKMMDDLTGNIVKGPGFSKSIENNLEMYKSSRMLGLGTISVSRPDTRYKEYKMMGKNIHRFHVELERAIISTGDKGETIEFSVDSSSLKELASHCKRLADSYEGLKTILSVLTTIEKTWRIANLLKVITTAPVGAVASAAVMTGGGWLLFKSVRGHYASLGIINATTGSAFMFSRGNISAAIKIKEKVRKQL